MKVFISWSGPRSKAVAELLSDWIKCVLQAARPWISTRDIDRGALWFSEISDQLKDTTVGVICLTQENKTKPWILFEAGALAKGLSSNRVCTLLVDLKPTDIEDPLAQFNHTLPDKDGLWQLVKTLNSTLGISGLDERILEQVFETYWPQFEAKFAQALKSTPAGQKPEPRSEKNLLAEILENTRFLNQKVRNLELRAEREIAFDPRYFAEAKHTNDLLDPTAFDLQALKEKEQQILFSKKMERFHGLSNLEIDHIRNTKTKKPPETN